jgi:hypothetical protein
MMLKSPFGMSIFSQDGCLDASRPKGSFYQIERSRPAVSPLQEKAPWVGPKKGSWVKILRPESYW